MTRWNHDAWRFWRPGLRRARGMRGMQDAGHSALPALGVSKHWQALGVELPGCIGPVFCISQARVSTKARQNPSQCRTELRPSWETPVLSYLSYVEWRESLACRHDAGLYLTYRLSTHRASWFAKPQFKLQQRPLSSSVNCRSTSTPCWASAPSEDLGRLMFEYSLLSDRRSLFTNSGIITQSGIPP